MTTVNLVLTILLSAMIGFAIGNVWGKETMKRTFSELLNKLTEQFRMAANTTHDKKEE